MERKECKKVRRAMLLGCLLPWSTVDDNENLQLAERERCAHLTSRCPLLRNPSAATPPKSSTCAVRGPCRDRGAPMQRGFLPDSAAEDTGTGATKDFGGVLKKPLRVVMEEVPCPGSKSPNMAKTAGKIEMQFDQTGQIVKGFPSGLPVILKVEKDDSRPNETLLKIIYCKRTPDSSTETQTAMKTAPDGKPTLCRGKPQFKPPTKCPSSPAMKDEAPPHKTKSCPKIPPNSKGGTGGGGCTSPPNTLKISCGPKGGSAPGNQAGQKSKSAGALLGGKTGAKTKLKIIMEEAISKDDAKTKSSFEINFEDNGQGRAVNSPDSTLVIMSARREDKNGTETTIKLRYVIKNARHTPTGETEALDQPIDKAPSISQEDGDYIEPMSGKIGSPMASDNGVVGEPGAERAANDFDPEAEEYLEKEDALEGVEDDYPEASEPATDEDGAGTRSAAEDESELEAAEEEPEFDAGGEEPEFDGAEEEPGYDSEVEDDPAPEAEHYEQEEEEPDEEEPAQAAHSKKLSPEPSDEGYGGDEQYSDQYPDYDEDDDDDDDDDDDEKEGKVANTALIITPANMSGTNPTENTHKCVNHTHTKIRCLWSRPNSSKKPLEERRDVIKKKLQRNTTGDSLQQQPAKETQNKMKRGIVTNGGFRATGSLRSSRACSRTLPYQITNMMVNEIHETPRKQLVHNFLGQIPPLSSRRRLVTTFARYRNKARKRYKETQV